MKSDAAPERNAIALMRGYSSSLDYRKPGHSLKFRAKESEMVRPHTYQNQDSSPASSSSSSASEQSARQRRLGDQMTEALATAGGQGDGRTYDTGTTYTRRPPQQDQPPAPNAGTPETSGSVDQPDIPAPRTPSPPRAQTSPPREQTPPPRAQTPPPREQAVPPRAQTPPPPRQPAEPPRAQPEPSPSGQVIIQLENDSVELNQRNLIDEEQSMDLDQLERREQSLLEQMRQNRPGSSLPATSQASLGSVGSQGRRGNFGRSRLSNLLPSGVALPRVSNPNASNPNASVSISMLRPDDSAELEQRPNDAPPPAAPETNLERFRRTVERPFLSMGTLNDVTELTYVPMLKALIVDRPNTIGDPFIAGGTDMRTRIPFQGRPAYKVVDAILRSSALGMGITTVVRRFVAPAWNATDPTTKNLAYATLGGAGIAGAMYLGGGMQQLASDLANHKLYSAANDIMLRMRQGGPGNSSAEITAEIKDLFDQVGQGEKFDQYMDAARRFVADDPDFRAELVGREEGLEGDSNDEVEDEVNDEGVPLAPTERTQTSQPTEFTAAPTRQTTFTPFVRSSDVPTSSGYFDADFNPGQPRSPNASGENLRSSRASSRNSSSQSILGRLRLNASNSSLERLRVNTSNSSLERLRVNTSNSSLERLRLNTSNNSLERFDVGSPNVSADQNNDLPDESADPVQDLMNNEILGEDMVSSSNLFRERSADLFRSRARRRPDDPSASGVIGNVGIPASASQPTLPVTPRTEDPRVQEPPSSSEQNLATPSMLPREPEVTQNEATSPFTVFDPEEEELETDSSSESESETEGLVPAG